LKSTVSDSKGPFLPFLIKEVCGLLAFFLRQFPRPSPPPSPMSDLFFSPATVSPLPPRFPLPSSCFFTTDFSPAPGLAEIPPPLPFREHVERTHGSEPPSQPFFFSSFAYLDRYFSGPPVSPFFFDTLFLLQTLRGASFAQSSVAYYAPPRDPSARFQCEGFFLPPPPKERHTCMHNSQGCFPVYFFFFQCLRTALPQTFASLFSPIRSFFSESSSSPFCAVFPTAV